MIKIHVQSIRIGRDGSISLHGVDIQVGEVGELLEVASSEVSHVFDDIFGEGDMLADPDRQPFFGTEAEAAEGMPSMPEEQDVVPCETRDAELIRRFESGDGQEGLA